MTVYCESEAMPRTVSTRCDENPIMSKTLQLTARQHAVSKLSVSMNMHTVQKQMRGRTIDFFTIHQSLNTITSHLTEPAGECIHHVLKTCLVRTLTDRLKD